MLGEQSEIDVSIYDRSNQECFLGHVRMCPLITREQQSGLDNWFALRPRTHHESIAGDIRLQISFERISKKHYGPDDFEVLRLIGKGEFNFALSSVRIVSVGPVADIIHRNLRSGLSGPEKGYQTDLCYESPV